ncbi:phospho-sugar mutase [Zhihengliuella halotolerans]|uniref:Phosphomannomutase n=1 Tax=Zhihengliuella halotolerans TaxID=370736 RepID=A0A4Q8AEG8_9MICC|nr:phospho-sugar mutase [Zhihengliuella halotolerans]RZU62043.1 phosphomannomutase [Zhihengliuella halotolerans]
MSASNDARTYPPVDLVAEARRWIGEDPDSTTAADLARVLEAAEAGDAAARADLTSRFATTLAFGTAGLRAELGAGPNRMNRVVVRRTAAGLAAHLLGIAAGAYAPRAVIGYDARHNSDVFAEETAAIFTAAGIDAFLLPSALPTPVLAYAVRALDAEAGVMVTASHNPPRDNGYKVYLGGRAVDDAGRGAQIVAPADAAIAAKIDYDGPLAAIQLADDGWTVLPESIADEYAGAVVALSPATEANRAERSATSIVLTSLHGVGSATMLGVFDRAGFSHVTPVIEQAEPDPDFPTVAFPNPEEPGAMDLALATAERVGADLVIANDPDADRCAAAVDVPGSGWRMLRGDEVGALLGSHVASGIASGLAAGNDDGAAAPVFANSIVSSRLLGRIAAAHGIEHHETLTGFKWISRVPRLTFGYEEALGYCVAPDLARDKDGMSAALVLADLAASLKASGGSLPQRLDELAVEHGLFATDQLSVRVDSLARLGEMMARLRAAPPSSLAGSPITRAQDLGTGGDLPPTDALLYVSGDDSRVIVRPSGTEPKLKAYLEVVEPVASVPDLPAARERAGERLAAVKNDIAAALNA